jgi:hypothetical protein
MSDDMVITGKASDVPAIPDDVTPKAAIVGGKAAIPRAGIAVVEAGVFDITDIAHATGITGIGCRATAQEQRGHGGSCEKQFSIRFQSSVKLAPLIMSAVRVMVL